MPAAESTTVSRPDRLERQFGLEHDDRFPGHAHARGTLAGGSRHFKLHTDEAQWQEAMTLNFTRQRQIADKLIDGMIAKGVFVRDRTKDPSCPNCFRLTAGVVAHTRQAVETLEALCENLR